VRKRRAPDQGPVGKDPKIPIDGRRFAHPSSVARVDAPGSRC
jgi:hypothetical protein